jgi:general secretion pathway protein D
MTRENFVHQVRWASLLPLLAALVAAQPSRAQQQAPPPPRRPGQLQPPRSPTAQPGPQPPAERQGEPPAPGQPAATRSTQPPATPPVDKRDILTGARTVVMSFDKRDLTEVIQFVSQFTQRNFILPERVSGKITILSNSPIPADDVWNVFVAALDANNWAVYPVGKYWKLVEKKQSSRANIPIFLEKGQEPPPTEQMVTKLFKLRYVEADQMRNVLNQFTSRDSDFQIFPPDTLVISDLGLNMRRLEKLIEQLDQPGGSEEIHIVPVHYAGAQELAQKLTEIFQAQAPSPRGGVPRQLGVAEPIVQPGQPLPMLQPGQASVAAGPVQIGKIIPEERTNKLIVIAGARSFSRVMELIRQLDVPAGEGGVHVYYLENAKADEVASTLQALAQGARHTTGPGGARPPGIPAPPPGSAPAGPVSADLFSGEVKITADKNTNSLVVIASQADYRNLVKVVQRLDIRRRQVFVEAVIMEVDLESDLNVGVSMHGGTIVKDINFGGARGDAPVVVGSEMGGLNSLGGLASLGSLGGFLAGLQGPPITVPGLNITLPSFAILLNALQSSSDVNVISTPHVIMTDNTEGEITVGQNVPFQAGYAPGGLSSLTSGAGTGTGGTAAGALTGSLVGLGGIGSLYAPIQRQNVELRLRIKPQINESDYVRLDVDEQTEEIASNDPVLGPTTAKRSAKTTVVAKDQETVVIGGLIQERTIRGVKKVPVLGSLPVLGWLFRNETSKKTKTNLLLFLTPYIIRDQADYRRIFERKMAERAEFVKRFYGEETAYEGPIDYDRKPGPLSRVRRGTQQELNRYENGGPGGEDERVIRPVQRYAPPQMDKGDTARPPPSPAPLPLEPTDESAPGTQQPAPPAPEEPKPNPGE